MSEPNPQPPKNSTAKLEARPFDTVSNFTELYALLDKTPIGKSISHRIMTIIIDSKKFNPQRRFIAYTRFMTTLVDPAIRDAVNRLLITQDPVLSEIQHKETEKAERETSETFIRETTTQHIKNLEGKKADKWGEYMDQTLNDANKIDSDHPGFLAALSTAYEELLKTTGKSVLETKPVKRPKKNENESPEPKATSEIKTEKGEEEVIARLEKVIANVTKALEESRIARKLENHLLADLEKELVKLQEAEKEEINKQKKEPEVQKEDAGTEEILTDWKETIAVDTTKVVEPNTPEAGDKNEESSKSTEEMSTPEKIGNCFVEYCKNADNLAEFNVKSFGRSVAKILSEVNVKTIYRPINAQETYFGGRKSEASDMKAILVSIGGENYLLPYPLSVKEFDTLEDLFKFGADSSSPDKIQKIIPAEMAKKGKRWEVKTMGQLN